MNHGLFLRFCDLVHMCLILIYLILFEHIQVSRHHDVCKTFAVLADIENRGCSPRCIHKMLGVFYPVKFSIVHVHILIQTGVLIHRRIKCAPPQVWLLVYKPPEYYTIP